MANGMSTLVSGVAGLAGTAAVAAAGVTLLRRAQPAYLPAGHALTPAGSGDPLPAVLRAGLAGLTVAVRPGPHGELFLGHGEPQPGRTLRRLVLSPLLARARSRGGELCAGQQVPFRLVVEFVGPDRDQGTLLRAYRLLDTQLRDHAPVLSRCVGRLLEPGAVTVAITGIVDARGLLATQHERYAFADGSFDDLGTPDVPPALAPMISEPWRRRFGWDGREPLPAEERHLLHALVRAAHDEGRTVRIGGFPAPRRARRRFWDELIAAGVDVIADTDVAGLARYLRHRSGRAVPAAPRKSARRPTAEPA